MTTQPTGPKPVPTPVQEPSTPPLVVSNKLYDATKWVAQVLLPALGTLYVALASLWNWPSPNEVGGSVLAADTFLGVILHLSKSQYDNSAASHDGVIDVETTPEGKKTFMLGLNGDPENLDQQDTVVFKVNKK